MTNRFRAAECGDKQRHPDKAAARSHLRALVHRGAAVFRLNVYRCMHCRAWHVGHLPTPRRNRG